MYNQKRTVDTELSAHPSHLTTWAAVPVATLGGLLHNSAPSTAGRGWLARNCICTNLAPWPGHSGFYYLLPSAGMFSPWNQHQGTTAPFPLKSNGIKSYKMTDWGRISQSKPLGEEQRQSWSLAAVLPSTAGTAFETAVSNKRTTHIKYRWQAPNAVAVLLLMTIGLPVR